MKGADCARSQERHCLFRCGAKRATCFCPQPARLVNARDENWFASQTIRSLLRCDISTESAQRRRASLCLLPLRWWRRLFGGLAVWSPHPLGLMPLRFTALWLAVRQVGTEGGKGPPLRGWNPSLDSACSVKAISTPPSSALECQAFNIRSSGKGCRSSHFGLDTVPLDAHASAEVLADGQPQPGLRQVCLTSFAEATLQHEKLKPSIGIQLDRGSGGPLLYADILAPMLVARATSSPILSSMRRSTPGPITPSGEILPHGTETSAQVCRGSVATSLARSPHRWREQRWFRPATLPSLVQNRASRAVAHRRALRGAHGSCHPTAKRWRDPKFREGTMKFPLRPGSHDNRESTAAPVRHQRKWLAQVS
jgi:hypothetical protein